MAVLLSEGIEWVTLLFIPTVDLLLVELLLDRVTVFTGENFSPTSKNTNLKRVLGIFVGYFQPAQLHMQ